MITPRLQKIIDLVDDKIIADIGTDHAYIPIRLASTNRIIKAIATDKNKGPLEIAKNNIAKYELSDIIETRLGEGLEPIKSGECELVIIAGMGGKLIGDIIEKDLEKSKTFKFLLQPMNAQAELRKRLIENGFKITKEELSCEGFKVYNTFLCEKGEQNMPEEINLHIPQQLCTHELFEMLVDKKIRELEKIIKGLETAKEPNLSDLQGFKILLKNIKELYRRD